MDAEALRFRSAASIIFGAMELDYDVVIIGGAFSGAATALVLKRKHPAARILIVEKSAEFDRKVGESTTELSSCYLTRLLGLTNYLGHHHLAKQGLRMWFANQPDQAFDDCVELGAKYQARLPTFQVDRSTLDQHMLDIAVEAGCDLQRPAKVTGIELEGDAASVSFDTTTVRARWVVDASGRATMLARKLGYLEPNLEHPINAVWARFTGVKDWDSYEWREKFRDYANACRTSRNWATNHLMGHGWWCWIIPLKGGDVSAGIVYDSRIFKLAEGASLAERLRAHLLSHPVGAEIFGGAQVIEGDIHAFSAMPYWSAKVCGNEWLSVGDATGFIDPLYSPGLDFCSYTSYFAADLLARSLAGEDASDALSYYNEQYPVTYRLWFETLYKDKYFYMGDAELMAAALLLDVGMYFAGLVIPVYKDPEREFLHLPFEGTAGRIVGAMMKFYNRRLVVLAKRRLAKGCFGRRNAGWRELYDGFVADRRVAKLIRKGLFHWWRAELTNLRLIFARAAQQQPASHSAASSAPVAAPL
ncbi:MAG TPA: NAD(P)/FAD-dependent oxidoreductase [Chthoniobacterales bacterium]|nr:NAD(P)/FAD-dependent oxidoreductase [Chthoniobacterales bacterium]